MKLRELLRDVPVRTSRGDLGTEITNVTADSRLAVAGSLGVRNTPPQIQIAAETGPLRTVPGECRMQLTAVLAGMVLHGWQQGRQA